MADRAEVPSSPLVTIVVDDRGRITINGHDVPHDGSVDPGLLATDVVSADFARPLGRPVRALVTLPNEQIRMVIHPDGRVTEVEPHQPATPEGVPPATRAQGWLATRDAHRAAAEVSAARHASRRRRYPLVVSGAGAIAAATALLVVWDQRAPASDPAAEPSTRVAAGEVPPFQPVVEATLIRPYAVSDVSAEAEPGALTLTMATQRGTSARVVVTRLDGSADDRRLKLTIRRATDRLVTVADLEPGRYRWRVVVPGQPPHTGLVEVPAVPAPVEVVPVVVEEEPTDQPADDPAGETADSGSSPAPDGGGDAQQPVGVSDGPDHPVDPDGD